MIVNLIAALFFLLAGIIWIRISKKEISRLIGRNKLIIVNLCLIWSIVFIIHAMEYIHPVYTDVFSVSHHILETVGMLVLLKVSYSHYKKNKGDKR